MASNLLILHPNIGLLMACQLNASSPKKLRDFALEIWKTHNAKGEIEFGSIPYRENEIMRYVPDIQKEYFLR